MILVVAIRLFPSMTPIRRGKKRYHPRAGAPEAGSDRTADGSGGNSRGGDRARFQQRVDGDLRFWRDPSVAACGKRGCSFESGRNTALWGRRSYADAATSHLFPPANHRTNQYEPEYCGLRSPELGLEGDWRTYRDPDVPGERFADPTGRCGTDRADCHEPCLKRQGCDAGRRAAYDRNRVGQPG